MIYRVLFALFAASTTLFSADYNSKDKKITPVSFNIIDTEPNCIESDVVEPWKVIRINPEYGGAWAFAGDLDGNGNIEIVSSQTAKCDDFVSKAGRDNCYTSSIAAQKLDGTLLWHWGKPNAGSRAYYGDNAFQVYDWNGDNRNEVVVIGKDCVYELEGKTGKELRKIPLPDKNATTALIFCNLHGGARNDDVLIKNRYKQLWALDRNGTVLWTTALPYGCWVGHHPLPVDIDDDGKDEIFCGYAMLNADGSLRWKISGTKANLIRPSHMDSQVVIRKGKKPEEWLFALSFCVGENIAVVNGLGQVQWELSGYHFESVNIGQVFPSDIPNLLVDVDHTPKGNSPVLVLNTNGTVLGRIVIDYSRYHGLVDWDGDGYDDIVVGDNKGIYNYKGKKIATLNMPTFGRCLQIGNFTGHGKRDILLVNGNDGDSLYIFENKNDKLTNTKLGTKFNFSLY